MEKLIQHLGVMRVSKNGLKMRKKCREKSGKQSVIFLTNEAFRSPLRTCLLYMYSKKDSKQQLHTGFISRGNRKAMRMETRNFCWGMAPDDIEEGFVIPFRPDVQQGMDGVVIETKCVPESEYTLGHPPQDKAWFNLWFNFTDSRGFPLLTEELALEFNYTWEEVKYFQDRLEHFEKKGLIEFGGIEPFGWLKAHASEDTIHAEFHFDAWYYLSPEPIFGGDFWFSIDMTRQEFFIFTKTLIDETLMACDPDIEHEDMRWKPASPLWNKRFMPQEETCPFESFGNELFKNIGEIKTPSELLSLFTRYPDQPSTDQHDRTLLMAASAQCLNPMVIRFLAKDIDVNACDESGHTALSMALRYEKSPEVVAELLELGADADHILPDGTTLYTQAAFNERGHELLTAMPRWTACADANTPDKHGRTPLHHAALFGLNSDIFQALLDYRANPNSRDSAGRTPLHEVARCTWYPRAAYELLKAGADIEARDIRGKTPLMESAVRGDGQPYMMRILRAGGANLYAKDNDGLTAADLAEQNGNKAIAEELLLFMKE